MLKGGQHCESNLPSWAPGPEVLLQKTGDAFAEKVEDMLFHGCLACSNGSQRPSAGRRLLRNWNANAN